MKNGSGKKGTSGVNLTAEERVRMFNAVWAATEKDYRGTTEDGAKAVLGHAKFGSGVQSAKTISEEEGGLLFLVQFRTFQKPASMRVSRDHPLGTRMNTGFSDPPPNPEIRLRCG